MNEKRYREYSREFKLEALELLRRGDRSIAQIERELGITPGLLMKWNRRYQVVEEERQSAQIGTSDTEAAKAQIRRLQCGLANAEEERKILKKYSVSSNEKAAEVRFHGSA